MIGRAPLEVEVRSKLVTTVIVDEDESLGACIETPELLLAGLSNEDVEVWSRTLENPLLAIDEIDMVVLASRVDSGSTAYDGVKGEDEEVRLSMLEGRVPEEELMEDP